MKYILILAFLIMPTISYAGDGHDHGESAFAKGSVFLTSFKLSDYMKKNLDIKTIIVKKTPLQESIKLPCVIKNPPELSSIITVIYMSKIEKIYVTLGEAVKKGQVLYRVLSYKTAESVDIKATIDGVISAQNIKVGQIVQQDTNLAEISTNKYFLAEGMAYLSDDISHIMVGDTANIKIDGTHENAKGVVKSFSPIVDAQNKTKSILVYFESADSHIFPNMFCEMTISFGSKTDAVAVPKRAVLGEFGHYFVFVKHGEYFEKQEVVLGIESGDKIEIREGLSEGQEIVVNGNYQLQFINASNSDASSEEADTHNHTDEDDHVDKEEHKDSDSHNDEHDKEEVHNHD